MQELVIVATKTDMPHKRIYFLFSIAAGSPHEPAVRHQKNTPRDHAAKSEGATPHQPRFAAFPHRGQGGDGFGLWRFLPAGRKT
jgi:hypothetical protein